MICDDDVEIVVRVRRSDLTIVEAQPTMVSQKTSERALGIPRRQFLESLVDFRRDGGSVLSLGKIRIVDRVAYIAWLTARTASERKEPERESETDLERELGLRRVG